ncbi:hypothetical protein [Mycolicibacterium arseniciresistens]|uniref:Uncharacterized protein n=1 Tax=Mycolicibacterium arseniciresistens TaxID=3062257 RepID=A0ABT8UJJ3_9MYCO|nr:hypothetical protein [Mycolicibacterium arseniciresistens]MDO3637967.1 hypothetical protein [Mycolicibacterium arseniciresistens]
MAMNHRLTGLQAAAALADLGFASIAAGVLARRRVVMPVLERLQADERAVKSAPITKTPIRCRSS